MFEAVLDCITACHYYNYLHVYIICSTNLDLLLKILGVLKNGVPSVNNSSFLVSFMWSLNVSFALAKAANIILDLYRTFSLVSWIDTDNGAGFGTAKNKYI